MLFEFMLFEFMFELALAFLFLFPLVPLFAFLFDMLPDVLDIFVLPISPVFVFIVVVFMFVVVPDVLAFVFLLPLPQSFANIERVSRSRMTKPCFIHFSPMIKG